MSRVLLAIVTSVLLSGIIYQSAVIHAEEKKRVVRKQQVAITNVPDREVEYEDSLSPEWKENWDLARELYRDEKYREALVQYEILLSQKENCDEARWEYVTLLIMQQRWNAAGEQLEKLLANDPDSMDYGFSMAEVNVQLGKLEEAAKIYRALYSSAKDHQRKIRAIKGLIKVLEMEGDDVALISSLEKLIALQPDAIGPKTKLARILIDNDNMEKAHDILARLEQQQPEDIEVLRLFSGFYIKLGDKEREAEYRQKIISVDPRDLESHAMLQEYYYDQGNWPMSLKHLEALLAEKPDETDYLETAADLNLKLERIDRALEYYDAILSMQPNNKNILKKKTEAQQMLARDLVVLVEHDGGKKLWQDLVQVTADRLGVYREIANILREKSNTDDLIEVLTLISQEDPSDEEIQTELNSMMKKKGTGGSSQKSQSELEKNNK